ncbi:MAG TPA: 50S ribosomal protein L35 [Candidatus Limnocylindrales bacterium]|jgi:large subunit ribosomal protein L35|nr:50S ribosomal protein L35 [Candidatus Limnocylindrales bacterium]
MPKMKTHRGAAKRLKKTGTGKLKRMRANKSHILTKKTTKRKRRLRKPDIVAKGDAKRLHKILPYGT